MNRLALLLLVGFLAASTGGILDLVLPERCSPTESASSPSDGACPATCIRCHCALAFNFVVHLDIVDVPLRSPEWLPASSVFPQPIPHDILHVPRLTLG